MTYPEKIQTWVKREFNSKYVEQVTTDLINVATGNRAGNAFEKAALNAIFNQ